MLGKLVRFEKILEPLIFEKKDKIEGLKAYKTTERLHNIPDDSLFEDADYGYKWGGEGNYCWFKGSYTVPAELDGRQLFIWPKIDCYEGMLWVNGQPYGIFANKFHQTAHGNHYCALFTTEAHAGETYEIAIEFYAGHYYPGCAPLENLPQPKFFFENEGIDICVKNYEISDFYFDLKTLNQLAAYLPKEDFRRAQVVNALMEAHDILYYSFEDTDYEEFIGGIRAAKPILKEALSVKSDDSAPTAAITGHSHMDTAWLWHVGETVKKCARTYANQLALMDEYPEYHFIQSSSCHSDFIRKYYPDLFEKIRERVAEGRYEPNGAVWVECDCNITGGEAMVRQFLWGQRFTRKYFDYTSNCFWLPDTFGYSAAIPQIMKGCGVDYFLTTKISWNDTNTFPIDTFHWEGIDGTRVFAHFNTTHHFPDAQNVPDRLAGIKQKNVNDKRLLAFGFGDGGGGPQFEEIELARRIEDISGIGKTKFMAVGDFMKELEATSNRPDVFKGELYLELHRGTLTNQHNIKRNNRKSEIALHNLEFLTVNNAVKAGVEADNDTNNKLWETLLINQFHDILPGTCIHRAHVESKAETGKLLKDADELTKILTKAEGDCVTFINPCGFDRNDVIFTSFDGKFVEGFKQQVYKNLDGKEVLMIAGVEIPAYGSTTVKLTDKAPEDESLFVRNGDVLETPFASVKFAEDGTISSFIDKSCDREIKGDGENLGALVMAEDLPESWDNWDIDADLEGKYHNVSKLENSKIIADGSVAYIIRNTYKISSKSSVTVDSIFFADSAEVRYDIAMDWQDNHRLLKMCFDTNVFDDFARQEIQFGFVKRPTTRNTSVEKAKFEVLNHKYSDISESRYGVAVLNDCKYGTSVKGGSIRPTLHKGGCRPDSEGDHDGIHRCVISLLPHNCGFGVDAVTKPGYLLNYPAIKTSGKYELEKLFEVASDNIVIETIKPCEDKEKAYILRMYEAEGARTVTGYKAPGKAFECNMLEEVACECAEKLTFRPFEIKTIKVVY